MQAIAARTLFSLVRLTPLLAALRSPIASAMGDAVACQVEGGQVDDASLIALSDYVEASRQDGQIQEPRSFEFRIAFMCLIASGAGEPAWDSGEAAVLVDARGLWRSVDVSLASARHPGCPPSPVGFFEKREATWQEGEQRLFPSGEVQQSDVSSHVEDLIDRVLAKFEIAFHGAPASVDQSFGCGALVLHEGAHDSLDERVILLRVEAEVVKCVDSHDMQRVSPPPQAVRRFQRYGAAKGVSGEHYLVQAEMIHQDHEVFGRRLDGERKGFQDRCIYPRPTCEEKPWTPIWTPF